MRRNPDLCERDPLPTASGKMVSKESGHAQAGRFRGLSPSPQSLLKMAEPTKKVSESGDEVSNDSDSATSASSSCGDDLGE